jgi:hypothetical protein
MPDMPNGELIGKRAGYSVSHVEKVPMHPKEAFLRRHSLHEADVELVTETMEARLDDQRYGTRTRRTLLAVTGLEKQFPTTLINTMIFRAEASQKEREFDAAEFDRREDDYEAGTTTYTEIEDYLGRPMRGSREIDYDLASRASRARDINYIPF